MTQQIRQIRENLIQASAYQSEIYPYPSTELKQSLTDAWQRYYRISELADQQRSRPGKQDNMGFIGIAALAVAGIATLVGGSWLLGRELNESKRLELLNKCIADATKSGVTLQAAQKACNQLYGSQPTFSFDVGPGGLNTTLLLMGGVGIVGLIVASKYL